MTPVQRQPDAIAVAYLRRSVEKRRPEDRDGGAGQRAEIAALAERKGETIARVYAADWGISGQRESLERRTDMAAILTGIRAGSVASLWAYSVDRLARDDAFGLLLRDACVDAAVVVHTKLDGSFDFSDERDRDYWGRRVTDAANMGRRYTRVNQDTKAEQRRHIATCPKLGRTHKGDCDARCIPGEHCAYRHHMGGTLPYGHDPDYGDEDASVVVEAYREAKTMLGATRLLQTRGVRPRRAAIWKARSVDLIVRRELAEAPGAVPVILPREGVSSNRLHLFSGLVVCRCGSVCVVHTRGGRPRKDGSLGPDAKSYRCLIGGLGGHPKITGPDGVKRDDKVPLMIAESKVKAFMVAETADDLEMIAKYADAEAGAGMTLASIARREADIAGLIATGKLSGATAAKALDALHRQAAKAETRKATGFLLRRPIDWDLPPAEVNAALRARFERIELGPDMAPLRAVRVDDLTGDGSEG